MTEVISIHSGKGGTGKTFTAANLSLALQELGENTVCIDTDINSPNLAIQLGQTPEDFTLDDALEDDIDPVKSVHIHESGLMFLPASLSLSDEKITEERLGKIVDNFSEFADKIVIDTAPGFGEEFYASLGISDRVLIVTSPEVQALNDAKKIVEQAGEMGREVEGVVLNKTENLLEEKNAGEVEDVTGSEVLFEIPYLKRARESVHRGSPMTLDRYSKVGNQFKKLAAELAGKDFRPPRHAPLLRALRKLGGIR